MHIPIAYIPIAISIICFRNYRAVINKQKLFTIEINKGNSSEFLPMIEQKVNTYIESYLVLLQ